MTVTAEWAKSAQRMEYILAIEGVGWLTDDTSFASGFDGDVFVTADLNGDLASILGCTIHRGLRVTGTVQDTLDPVTAKYSLGGMSFSVVDDDDWFISNYTPNATWGLTESISTSAVAYKDTTIEIDDGTQFSDGQVVWIGGREAVKLGTGGAPVGTKVSYTGCTRGYLGTPRGRAAQTTSTAHGFEWDTGTTVYSIHRLWNDRYMELYAHVPGEAVSNLYRLWTGKLRDISEPAHGIEVKLSGVGEMIRHTGRIVPGLDMVLTSQSTPVDYNWFQVHMLMASGNVIPYRKYEFQPRTGFVDAGIRGQNKYAVAVGYRYRTEPGGTAGMKATWDAGSTVQAMTTSAGVPDVSCRFLRIGEEIVFVKKRDSDATDESQNAFQVEWFSRVGTSTPEQFDDNFANLPPYPPDTPCKFLLDNWTESAEINRYTVNKRVSRNIVDILLCHLTSRNDEYWIKDATGGTATVPTFAASSVGAANIWAGAALFCVEGNNKGEARVITSNTTSAITVEDGFTNAPTAATEYQVRNSIYDVLPLGWGLGIPFGRIDIDSFETLRDKHLSDVNAAPYMLGLEAEFDIWGFLAENILSPYGIHLYISPTTGKLSAQYLGEAHGDGIVDDYVAIVDADIIDAGPIKRLARPLGAISLEVRASERLPIRVGDWMEKVTGNINDALVYKSFAAQLGGEVQKINIKLGELDAAYTDSGYDSIATKAMLNTAENAEFLISRYQGFLRSRVVPPPTISLTLDAAHIGNIRAGVYVTITWSDSPTNPFEQTRGWTNVLGLVIGTEILVESGPAIQATIELLNDLNGGRVAPAARLTGAKFGSDGTSDWVVVAANEYTSDATNTKDYYTFAVGDLIEVRDESGALREGPLTIRSFGANDVSDPTAASTDIIRVDEVLASTGSYTTDDYVTFRPWNSASNTARMEKYSAYANAAGALTTGDTARRYA